MASCDTSAPCGALCSSFPPDGPRHTKVVGVSRVSPHRQAFLDLAQRDITTSDLPRAALLFASEVTSGLDVGAQLDRLAALGRAFVARQAHRDDSLRGRLEALNDVLFEHEGFRGCTDNYDDPRNSLLDQVMQRRTGIPITLSLVFLTVAREGGLHVDGVGLPGHFIVVAREGAREVLVDPFHRGQILSAADCRRRVETVLGPRAGWRDEWLRPSPPRLILVRMLNNLKRVYLRATDYRNALWVEDLLVALTPDEAVEYRDRGLVNAQLRRYADARRDLGEYLERAGGRAPDAAQITADLERLRRLHQMLN